MIKYVRFSFIISCAILLVCASAGLLFADSCPHCGLEYEEGSGNDWDYISRIRAEHEANCPARYRSSSSSTSSGSSGGGYSGGGHAAPGGVTWEVYNARMRYEEEHLREQKERSRRERLKEEQRRQAEEARKKGKFIKNKDDLLSSLKGSGAKGLDLKASKQEEYYRTLKIKDVPLPSLKGRTVSRRRLREGKRTEAAKKAHGMTGSGKNYVKEFVDWLHLRMFDETFNRIPGMGTIRSVQQKTKKLFRGMRGLVVDIYNHGMGGVETGIRRLASPRFWSSDYDEEEAGRRAIDRAGSMAEDEIAGRGSI